MARSLIRSWSDHHAKAAHSKGKLPSLPSSGVQQQHHHGGSLGALGTLERLSMRRRQQEAEAAEGAADKREPPSRMTRGSRASGWLPMSA